MTIRKDSPADALRQSVGRFCKNPDGLYEFISVISCINSLPKGALTVKSKIVCKFFQVKIVKA